MVGARARPPAAPATPGQGALYAQPRARMASRPLKARVCGRERPFHSASARRSFSKDDATRSNARRAIGNAKYNRQSFRAAADKHRASIVDTIHQIAQALMACSGAYNNKDIISLAPDQPPE